MATLTLREAAQQALKVLELPVLLGGLGTHHYVDVLLAVKALRTALADEASPAQETETKLREEFEAAMKDHLDWPLSWFMRCDNGDYLLGHANNAWQIWQADLTQPTCAMGEICPCCPPEQQAKCFAADAEASINETNAQLVSNYIKLVTSLNF